MGKMKKVDGSELSREEQQQLVRSSLDDLELKMMSDLKKMMGARMVSFETETHVIDKRGPEWEGVDE